MEEYMSDRTLFTIVIPDTKVRKTQPPKVKIHRDKKLYSRKQKHKEHYSGYSHCSVFLFIFYGSQYYDFINGRYYDASKTSYYTKL